ncbi:MAG: hypothetical protein HOV80_13040 [Polyangiaceae bacterium]|nr:hypothetical protein [Polyangiaceae bacterium]
MSFEEDPEVIADLRFRESSMFDRTRTGEARWSAPTIVERVPCRARCGAVVEWTDEAEERFQIFNRHLIGKREAPLDKTKICFCDGCRAKGRKAAAESNRDRVDYMRPLILELRGDPAPNGQREREIIEKLKKAGHPDIEGLCQAIKARRESKPQGRTRRGAM